MGSVAWGVDFKPGWSAAAGVELAPSAVGFEPWSVVAPCAVGAALLPVDAVPLASGAPGALGGAAVAGAALAGGAAVTLEELLVGGATGSACGVRICTPACIPRVLSVAGGAGAVCPPCGLAEPPPSLEPGPTALPLIELLPPGFRTSVAAKVSFGGVRLGAPECAAVETSGPVLSIPRGEFTTPAKVEWCSFA